MREIERRVFKRRLSEVCSTNGLEFEIESRAGSHEAWKITDPKTQEMVTLILTSHRMVTKGVQREALKTASWYGAKIALGEVVRALLEEVLKNWWD